MGIFDQPRKKQITMPQIKPIDLSKFEKEMEKNYKKWKKFL
jgi:hypothetical protein